MIQTIYEHNFLFVIFYDYLCAPCNLTVMVEVYNIHSCEHKFTVQVYVPVHLINIHSCEHKSTSQ